MPPSPPSNPLERSDKGDTTMTNANTNTHNLHPIFHPAAHYDSPRSVLIDNELSTPEKRIILSSWASDMYAVESCPALREIPRHEPHDPAHGYSRSAAQARWRQRQR